MLAKRDKAMEAGGCWPESRLTACGRYRPIADSPRGVHVETERFRERVGKIVTKKPEKPE